MNNSELFYQSLPTSFPPQHQDRQPGLEYLMNPSPIFDNPYSSGSRKLINKVAIITGGDSGIGRAIAVAYAKEGANLVIAYYNEYEDASDTKMYVERFGVKCILLSGDIRDEAFCFKIIEETIKVFGHIDILVNNAGVAYPQNGIENISYEQLNSTFQVNVFSYFTMIKYCLPYLKYGDSIICTASSTAYSAVPTIIDYAASKAAVVGLIRSLAPDLIKKGIRVNGVAPGSTWTPLVPASTSAERVAVFGQNSPIGRAAQPFEIAPAYVYLASDDSSYIVGQVIHVDGGTTLS